MIEWVAKIAYHLRPFLKPIWERMKAVWRLFFLAYKLRNGVPASACEGCGNLTARVVWSVPDKEFYKNGVNHKYWRCGKCGHSWQARNDPQAEKQSSQG